ncbi:zinc ribbon domain-containing protein [Lachnospiraceae bacterium ZAX-1]
MFCNKCGNEIPHESKFCPNCGADMETALPLKASVIEPIPIIEPTKKGVFCPNCHSYDLESTSETETKVSGGGYSCGTGCCGSLLLGPIGWLCGLGGKEIHSNSTTRHFWICRSCGHKFRNAEDNFAENKRIFAENKKTFITVIAVCALAFFGGIFLAVEGIRFFWIPGWVYIIVGLIGMGLGAFAFYDANAKYKETMEQYK